jgi:hypothetical protein
MAYFNHAFQKAFLGTAGFINTATTATSALTKGQFALVDPKTWQVPTDVDAASTLRCPLVLAAGSLYQNDKIGPFHGGYKESSKSKLINPKYVTRFYRVDPCALQQATISVGNTPYTVGGGDNWAIPSNNVCDKEFVCGKTYYLRVDLKGSPVLRFLSRNSYFVASYDTGCCPTDSGTPTPIDGTLVYINWAKQLLTSPLMAPFLQIEVFDAAGASIGVYDKATYDAAVRAGNLSWDAYTPTPTPDPATDTPGMYMTGAYVDTQFGNCTFYPTDALQAYLEPVKLYASEVDFNGEICEFTGLCVANVCSPVQGTGWGETVVRDLILTQGYEQAPFYTGKDLRVREITQGYDVTDSIDRIAPGNQYYRYYIQHSVPRLNNPTGTFDNDQYLLEIITDQVEAVFEQFMFDWLTNAGSGCSLDPTQNAGAGGPEVIACPATCTIPD